MFNVIEGSYTTRRGGGIMFRYAGNWKITPEEIVWKVKTWRGRDYSGEIAGSIAGGAPIDVPSLLRVHIQESIEDKNE